MTICTELQRDMNLMRAKSEVDSARRRLNLARAVLHAAERRLGDTKIGMRLR